MSRRITAEEKKRSYISIAISTLVFITIVKAIRPQTIPFDFFHFWKIGGSLIEAVKHSWILLLWGTGITTLVSVFTRNSREENRYAEDHLLNGLLVSIKAGVMEEICFRWILFFGAMVSLKIVNWLFFGWAGFGIAEWFYTHFFIPVANFFTLGYLKPILMNGFGWAVGAAVISVNGDFRNGHAYQGIIGMINSWFGGMFFFYLMFKYGLPAAILVHFLYDLFIFVVEYVDRVIERHRGWG